MVDVPDFLAGIDVNPDCHWSLLSFRCPQWGSFRDELNSGTWPRFNASKTPMRAIMTGWH
jgi:hypothetical protein